jgi:mRNA-degrading endonuclease YafQ of YafQ-DinJ toxin-antitoxin module
MKQVSQTTQFARDIKRMRKRGKDLAKLQAVVRQLGS